jgi:pimeloyl-[acyl-carrier protein] methyl ester esterase
MSSLYQRYPSNNTNAFNVVLLQGWGMNTSVWQRLLPYLQNTFHVTVIDATIDINEILAVAPQRAIWCGWSLGGLCAMTIATKYPERVQAVVMIACNPCFVARDDWPHAMSVGNFQAFQQGLTINPEATLKRFIALQCQGSSSQKHDARWLQQQLAMTPFPPLAVLQAGLATLKAADFRPQLAQLKQPVYSILGQEDNLVPSSIAKDLARVNPQLQCLAIAGAAHVPFVSHPQIVAEKLRQVAQELC